MGVVIFSGEAHVAAGKQCTDCHDLAGGGGGLYPMKQGTTKLTMAEMNEGKGCGTCHNGETAFSTADAATCTKCHKMQ
jgi:c(7)-type cytochrome triheme protein